MKRVLVSVAILLAIGAFVVIAGGASNNDSAAGTYKIELDNAFGLVSGADFKVAGVRAGKIQSIDLPKNCIDGGGNPTCHALVTVQVTQNGFGTFKSDAFCQSRPQSLIGEYFIDCQPGQYGKTLKAGSTIPVSHTESTIPADLVQDVMRLPYRQRFTLIINELGAAVAGRSGDLQGALRRAVPALTETDNLLNLLANDSHTLQQLTADSNSVVTALANNSKQVNRFIVEAGNTARDTAAQDSNLRVSIQRLPGLLEQLRPAMAKLGAAADANEPVLANLNSAAKNFNTLLRDLPAFSKSALPAIRSLGQGLGDRQGRGPGRQPHDQAPQPVRQADAGAGAEPFDRAARPRQPQPGGRGRPAQPGRQGLHGPRGAPPVRVHPAAGDQHVRAARPPAGRRRVRQLDLHAVCDAVDDRIDDQVAGCRRRALVLLGARPRPAGRHHDRPDEPQGVRTRSGRRSSGPEGHPDKCLQAAGLRGGRQPAQCLRRQRRQRLEHGHRLNRLGGHRGRLVLLGRRRWLAVERGLRPRVRRPGRARRDLVGAGRWLVDLEQCLDAVVCVVGRADPAAPQLPAGAMRTRSQQSAFANPVLIGAVTVLIVLIAVFLAYNANTGLPFVPTRELKVDIANGSNLVVGNEVRSGGFRVGVISEMKPIALPSGQTGAQLTLNLDQAHGKVPVDSSASIQPLSVLGTKYLDLHTGTSHQVISDGGLLPLGQTHVPVQFDDVFKTFDPKTRVAVQDSLAGAGDALTARGSALNDTIASLPPLLAHLQPVAKYLSDPSTNLTGFFDNLERFMGAVAPVAHGERGSV